MIKLKVSTDVGIFFLEGIVQLVRKSDIKRTSKVEFGSRNNSDD